MSKEALASWWGERSPMTRMVLVALGLILSLVGVSSLVAGEGSPKLLGGPEKPATTLLTPSARQVTTEALAADLAATMRNIGSLQTEIKNLQRTNEALAARANERPTPWRGEELAAQVQKLSRELDVLRNPPASQGAQLTSVQPRQQSRPQRAAEAIQQASTAPPAAASALHEPMAETDTLPPGLDEPLPQGGSTSGFDAPRARLRTVGPPIRQIVKAAPSAARELQGILGHFMAGGFARGVLLTGMDVPTTSIAKMNPTPVLIQLIADANLPNRHNAPVRDCFVIGSGVGVLGAERAEIRTERISCVRRDGTTLEAEFDGFLASEEDGKAGIRGRPVSKQGQFIAKSLAAGVLEGIARAAQPMMVPQLNTRPGSQVQTQTQDLETLARGGVFGGIGKAAEQVSQFYLDMAKEMVPVIEIDVGRYVTVVALRGLSLAQNDGEAPQQDRGTPDSRRAGAAIRRRKAAPNKAA